MRLEKEPPSRFSLLVVLLATATVCAFAVTACSSEATPVTFSEVHDAFSTAGIEMTPAERGAFASPDSNDGRCRALFSRDLRVSAVVCESEDYAPMVLADVPGDFDEIRSFSNPEDAREYLTRPTHGIAFMEFRQPNVSITYFGKSARVAASLVAVVNAIQP